MSKRKSNKQVKSMMVDVVKDEWFMLATEVWWSNKYGVCLEYIDGGYNEYSIGGVISIKAND